VKIKSTDVMSWYEYLFKYMSWVPTIHKLNDVIYSLIYISYSQKKQYTPNWKKSFKFYEAKDVQQKIYRKRMKNPGIWCHVSWELPYPSLKTFKKKKRVSNNNSCDSLHIHDNSTTNSCEEALKTNHLPWKLGNASDLANTMISYKCFIIYIYIYIYLGEIL
jgi:hypothetical protein